MTPFPATVDFARWQKNQSVDGHIDEHVDFSRTFSADIDGMDRANYLNPGDPNTISNRPICRKRML
jgi:hypothetical protein